MPPTGLKGAALSRVRANALALLTDTCLIEVQQAAQGAMNEPLDSWSLVAANVSCRVVDPEESDSAVVGAQENIADIKRLEVPPGTPFGTNQRVTIASTGHVYLVKGVIADRSVEVLRVAILLRRRGG